MILTFDLITTLTLGVGTFFFLCLIFSWKFIKFALVVYEQHNFRHNLTSDLIVALTLGVGI